MLNSALNHAGPRLSSFVLTSSFAACTDPQTPLPKTFTENDWNTWAEPKAKSKDFEDLDDNAKGRVLYLASKTAAERAVWEWREKREVSRNTGAELVSEELQLTLCFGTSANLASFRRVLDQSKLCHRPATSTSA